MILSFLESRTGCCPLLEDGGGRGVPAALTAPRGPWDPSTLPPLQLNPNQRREPEFGTFQGCLNHWSNHHKGLLQGDMAMLRGYPMGCRGCNTSQPYASQVPPCCTITPARSQIVSAEEKLSAMLESAGCSEEVRVRASQGEDACPCRLPAPTLQYCVLAPLLGLPGDPPKQAVLISSGTETSQRYTDTLKLRFLSGGVRARRAEGADE